MKIKTFAQYVACKFIEGNILGVSSPEGCWLKVNCCTLFVLVSVTSHFSNWYFGEWIKWDFGNETVVEQSVCEVTTWLFSLSTSWPLISHFTVWRHLPYVNTEQFNVILSLSSYSFTVKQNEITWDEHSTKQTNDLNYCNYNHHIYCFNKRVWDENILM